MANYTKIKNEGRVTNKIGPSPYGSHRSMVVRELEGGIVVCLDENGEYKTLANRLDSGLADPNRNSWRLS